VDSGEVDLGLDDESFDVAKPLVFALRELGPFTDPVVRILLEAGAGANLDQYTGSIRATTVSAIKKTRSFSALSRRPFLNGRILHDSLNLARFFALIS